MFEGEDGSKCIYGRAFLQLKFAFVQSFWRAWSWKFYAVGLDTLDMLTEKVHSNWG